MTIGKAEIDQVLHFPLAGVDVSLAFSTQPNRPTYQKRYARTCVDAVNVRGFDASDVFRGGSRAGLTRYVDARVSGTRWVVQNLSVVTGATYTGGGSMQTSQTGRVVTLVAVSQGQVYYLNAGGTAWTLATNNTGVNPPLNITGLVRSTEAFQKLYFADGTNWCYFDPLTSSVESVVATAGTLPTDADSNKPRLCGTWRGRLVWSGLLKDPQNWFMSRAGYPLNYDYSPESPSPDDAVAGNSPVTLGLLGDIVTAIIPHTDDILVMGGDHSIWAFRGDPMAGGRIDIVSSTIGIAWGEAWCRDPNGNIYFMSNKMGVYVMAPGQQPQRISQAIDQLLYEVNIGASSIRLQYDDRYQGVHVWITTLAAATATDRHWFFEARSGAWFPDEFANKNHNPGCCVTFDGNLPSDRVCLIGSWDGYVRALDGDATTDDGYDIESSVTIGPLLTQNMDRLNLVDVQAILDDNAGDVDYEILSGPSSQAALDSTPAETGTWEAGRNLLSNVNRSDHVIYIKISSTNPWAMESIRCRIRGLGKVARRGY